ncbi:MAG: DUF4162 domain-containing protein [Thermoplasmata archaeon]|nr:DUF4162 domain-containing protein [Thermoplasmata archaeon]
MDRGELIADGTPDELKDSIDGDVIKIRYEGDMNSLRTEMEKRGIKTMIVNDEMVMNVSKAEEIIPEIFRIAGNGIKSIMYKEPTLEDVFLYYTGREYREGRR